METLTIYYSSDFMCWYILNSGGIIIAQFSSKNKAKDYLVELSIMKSNRNEV